MIHASEPYNKVGEHDISVNPDLGLGFQVFVVPHALVEPTKGTVRFCQSVVHFLFNLGIR